MLLEHMEVHKLSPRYNEQEESKALQANQWWANKGPFKGTMGWYQNYREKAWETELKAKVKKTWVEF